jgi:biotin carboxyl carrier protein
METTITAPAAGRVASVAVAQGDNLEQGDLVVTIE